MYRFIKFFLDMIYKTKECTNLKKNLNEFNIYKMTKNINMLWNHFLNKMWAIAEMCGKLL